MKLVDIRKLTIKKHMRVSFPLPNGMECVIDEHGLSKVPRLNAPPDFNLEAELARATRFILEPVLTEEEQRRQKKSAAQTLSREELETLAKAGGRPGAGQTQDHEE